MLTYWETLTAIQSNVPVNDSYAQLWGRKSQGGYTVVTYIGTLPAVLTGTKAGYLHRYKIYGNTEQNSTPTPENPIEPSGCGERTENLFENNAAKHGYYSNGAFVPNNSYNCSKVVNAIAGQSYTFSVQSSHGAGCYIQLVYLDANYEYVDITSKTYNYIGTATISGIVPANASKIQAICIISSSEQMLTEGSTVPSSYIPYGYKLPLTSAGQNVDIYLGDDTLSTEEYVDSGTGKIYRMVSGTLTPVDPPVPFPQIPTTAGSTTISWAGEGLAPSQVELEYKKKR